MDLAVSYRPNPFLCSSPTSLFAASHDLAHLRGPIKRRPIKRRPKIYRDEPIFRASASSNSNGSEQFWSELGEAVKKETGFDSGEFVARVREGGDELTQFSSEFWSWNQWDCWKDLKKWDLKRIGVFVAYAFLVVISFNGLYIAIQAPWVARQKKELTEAYMDVLNPDNVRRFKRRAQRTTTPEGLKLKKHVNRPDRTRIHYSSFIGQDMGDGDPNPKIGISGVEVDILQKPQVHYFTKAVISSVPGVLLLCLVGGMILSLRVISNRFIYRMYNRFNGMVYTENLIMPVGAVCEMKLMSEEVVLGVDIWDLLDELMLYMRNPYKYRDGEVPFVRGFLLSGPPGTGKTLFARTLAKNGGLPFVYASGAEFTSGAGGAAKINELFHAARRNAPSFIFIDEIEAIAGKRMRNNMKTKAAFTALLDQLDGAKVKEGVDRSPVKQAVMFICATNIPEELDPEFVCAGRIDHHVKIGLPNEMQRLQIFSMHRARMQLAEDANFGNLVFRTVGYSGADIRNLVNEAAIMSVRNGHSKIYQKDIVDVLDKQLLEGMGVRLLTEDEQQKFEASVPLETKRLLAVHEAGHILLAHLFPRFDWHAFSQLLPGGEENAISVFYPREYILELPYTPIGYMKMQMVVAHSGRCAERIVFGDDITDGGTHDLIKITRIARELIISPQNKRLGLFPLTKRVRPKQSDNDKPIKYRWDDPDVIPVNMTPEVSELFTRELTRYIEETEELAMNSLRNNRHILDMIASDLLENSKITGLEVIENLKGLSPIMFDDFVEPSRIDLEKNGSLPRWDRTTVGCVSCASP